MRARRRKVRHIEDLVGRQLYLPGIGTALVVQRTPVDVAIETLASTPVTQEPSMTKPQEPRKHSAHVRHYLSQRESFLAALWLKDADIEDCHTYPALAAKMTAALRFTINEHHAKTLLETVERKLRAPEDDAARLKRLEGEVAAIASCLYALIQPGAVPAEAGAFFENNLRAIIDRLGP